MGDIAGDTLVYRKDDWGCSHDLYAIFNQLLSLEDKQVMQILTFVIAETLPSGSAMVELIGDMLSVDMRDHWQVQDKTAQTVFFDLLREKEAINAMLKHIGGERIAKSNVTATAKVQKQIIKDFINGENGRKAKPEWEPRYMRFPMHGYTKRQDTIEATKIGKKRGKVFE